MPTIIDFNGYYHGEDKFVIKEYSILLINRKGKIELNDIGVVKPLCNWEEVDDATRINYQQEFYSKFGINWDVGTSDVETVINNIIELSIDRKVYIRDYKHKELLANFIEMDVDNKFVSLVEDLEYAEPLKMSTHCGNHSDLLHNNCAIDNTYAMYEWLKKTKKYRNEIPKSKEVKKHVVVDFIGYYIPEDRFVIKEFNAFVIDNPRNIIGNELNKYFVTGKPGYLKKKPLELKDMPFNLQALYEAFYETFGIAWDTGKGNFRSYQKSLRGYFDNSINIYVRNNGNKKLLLELIGSEYESKIVVLKKFGYRFQPKLRTICSYHDKPEGNICAIDTSRHMYDWILQNRHKLNITDLK